MRLRLKQLESTVLLKDQEIDIKVILLRFKLPSYILEERTRAIKGYSEHSYERSTANIGR